jgi:propionyl-CoA carboxylase alpha chain
MGDKLVSKKTVSAFNIPLVPGTSNPVKDIREAEEITAEIGLPVLIKASAGGGGKGMRIVHDLKGLKDDFQSAINEAQAAFGDSSVFIEKYIQNPRHIEVQVLADQHGNVFHLNERECSVQRRHQKVVEEAPSAIVDDILRKELGQAAINVAKACNYINAGTVEFIMDENKKFYFLEMNTRLQVEHPVTELTTGIDLVEKQIEIAEGKVLDLSQENLHPKGHSIELRVYAEDPEDNFMPSIGNIKTYHLPEGEGIRVDGGYEKGMDIPIYYDPLISKLVVYDVNRKAAIEKMIRAIDGYKIEGIKTTLSFGKFVMENREFRNGAFDTNFVAKHYQPSVSTLNSELEKIAAIMTDYFVNEQEKNIIPLAKVNSNWRSRLQD